MNLLSPTMNLPLLYQTPAIWVKNVSTDIPALLSDHAYLERKAASNALELLNRWPEPVYPESWTVTLSAIARDEALHLNSVIRLLRQRGGSLQRLHRSAYAADLRKLVRRGLGPHEVLDRLLISALIEARSAERFDLLATHLEDQELAQFYRGLLISEMGHFNVFLQLGEEILPSQDVSSRWRRLLEAEAEIITAQAPGPCLHSGLLKI